MFSGFEWAIYIFRSDENERYVRAKIFFQSRPVLEDPHIGVVDLSESDGTMKRYSLTPVNVAKFTPCGFTHERLEFLYVGGVYIPQDAGEHDSVWVFRGLHVFYGSDGIFAKIVRSDRSIDYIELRYFLTFKLKAEV